MQGAHVLRTKYNILRSSEELEEQREAGLSLEMSYSKIVELVHLRSGSFMSPVITSLMMAGNHGGVEGTHCLRL